jgi:hypothetical protein
MLIIGDYNVKVSELIKKLKQHPLNMEVVVESYEEGFDPVTGLKIVSISKKENKEWYVGVYEEKPKSGNEALLIHSLYNRSEVDEYGE